MSKTPLARIAKLFDISMPTLYRRIDFIYRKCVEFVANRERRLIKKKFDRMYLCTDRQVQISNWTNRKEKQNCEFYLIGTADLSSNYVLAFNINYDPSLDPVEVEKHAAELGEHGKKKYYRHYARAWLQLDFEEAKRSKGKKQPLQGGSLKQDLEQQIEFNRIYDPEESSESFGKMNKLPTKGIEINNDYTMAAHFQLIAKLTSGVEKTRFFMNQDAGMSGWYIAAFKDKIKEGNSDGFTVKSKKNLTINDRLDFFDGQKREISQYCGVSYDSLSNEELNHVVRQMIQESMAEPVRSDNGFEAWVRNPMPSMNEIEKRIAAVTNIERYDLDHQAKLYKEASLNAIDRFFNQVRTSLNPFARPTRTANTNQGTWYGYQPYNPEIYIKLSEIFRVYYNYCNVDDKHKSTPAMKLGLAKGPVKVEKIIYFDKYKK